MSKCPSCGVENPVGVELCKKCGARIVDRDAATMPRPPTSGEGRAGPRPEPDSLEGQVLAELQAGRKIAAIKLYRMHRNVGLKEAKDTVEELAAQYGIVVQGGGCAGVLLLLLAVSAALITVLS